jgi:hypothetical protein
VAGVVRLEQRFDSLESKVDASSHQSRVLFEEVISRLKAMSNGRA